MSNYEQRDNNRNNFREREDDSKTQLFIAKGKNDGMDQQSLIDFICEKTQIDAQIISSVKVLDAFSFFAVPHEEAGQILDFFQAEAGEGRPLVSKAKRKKPNGGGSGGFGGGHRDGGFRNDRNNDRPRSDNRRSFGNNGGGYRNNDE